jgi:hypothetical protein
MQQCCGSGQDMGFLSGSRPLHVRTGSGQTDNFFGVDKCYQNKEQLFNYTVDVNNIFQIRFEQNVFVTKKY